METNSELSLNSDEVEKLRKNVQSSLLKLKQNRILGAQLGALVEQALQTALDNQTSSLENNQFNRGSTYKRYLPQENPPTLSTFVSQYLNGILTLTNEKSGPDNFYEIVGATPRLSTTGPVATSTSKALWKTFVAIYPPYLLLYDQDSADIRLAQKGSEVSDNEKTIPSATIQEHQQICMAFCDRLEHAGKPIEALRKIANDNYNAASYQPWLDRLRQDAINLDMPRLENEWGAFRSGKLFELFRERLEKIVDSKTQINQLVEKIKSDQKHRSKAKSTRDSIPLLSKTSTHVDPDVHDLFHAVIDRLQESEIRHMMVPFGAVLDAITNKKK